MKLNNSSIPTNWLLIRVLVVLLGSGAGAACAQSQTLYEKATPNFFNYSVEQGIPSNEAYHVITDRNGYIWAATDNGICKFDGRTFTVFNRQSGLVDNVVFKLFEDHLGRIWCSGHNHDLCYIENDSVVIYRYNHLIQEHIASNRILIGLAVDEVGTVHLTFTSQGYVRISAEGDFFQHNAEEFALGVGGLFFTRVMDQILTYNIKIGGSMFSSSDSTIEVVELVQDEGDVQEVLIYRDQFEPYIATFVDYGLMTPDSVVYLILQDQLVEIPAAGPVEVHRLDRGGIGINYFHDRVWTGIHSSGVIGFPSREFENQIELGQGLSISAGCADDEGGIWFSCLEKGLIYYPELQIRTLSAARWGDPTALLVEDNKVWIGFANGQLSQIDHKGEVTVKDLSKGWVRGIQSVSGLGTLAYAGYETKTLTDNTIINFGPHKSPYQCYYISEEIGGSTWWVSEYDIREIRQDSVRKKMSLDARLNEVRMLGETFYLGTKSGLMMYSLSSDTAIVRETPIGKQNIKALAADTAGVFAASSDGAIWFGNQDQPFEQFLPQPVANSIGCMVVAGGRLWVGTSKGLLVIDIAKRELVGRLAVKTGLSGNHIKKVVADEQYVYAASKGGIDLIPVDLAFEPTIPPMILQSVRVDGQIVPQTEITLAHNFDFIEFENQAITYSHAQDLRYRYQMEGIDEEAVLSESGGVRYSSLPPGKYRFRVAATTDGVHYTPERMVAVEVTAPYWRTWGFQALVLTAVALLIYLGVRLRTSRLRMKMEHRNRVLELRARALRAQMNPHFSFNVLNSIQSLILTHQTETATVFLADYARFLRTTLDLSSTSLIALEQELDICAAYIRLEELRFKDRVTFRLNTVEPLDKRFAVPPLLVQPFIENAIIHGMAEMEQGGEVEVAFASPHPGELRIRVTDNGRGFAPGPVGEQSKGIQLIRDRLLILNPKNKVELKRENDLTVVQLHIYRNA